MFKKNLDIFKNNFSKIDKVLFSIIAIGFLLRTFHLGRESIWVDEGFTYRLAKFTLPQYIDNVLGTLRNILPPFYFQITHFWTGIFGNSEFSLRFPSVIFGTLSILLMYFFAKNIFNKEVGLMSSILLSISLFHLQYSQEARMYEMLSFFSLVSFFVLVKFIKDNKWSSAFFLSLANIGLIYIHHYGFFIVISQYIFAIIIFKFDKNYLRENIKKWLALTFVFCLLITPWFFVLMNQVKKVYTDPWLPTPGVGSIYTLFVAFAGGRVLLLTYILLIAYWLFISKFSLKNVTKKENILRYKWYFLLLIWCFASIILSLIYSKLVSPIFGAKYLIASSLPFYILIAKSISIIKSRYFKYFIMFFIVTVSLISINNYYVEIQKEQWRQATRFIETYAHANDLVLVNAGFGLENGLSYYSKRNDIIKMPFPRRTEEVNTLVTEKDFPELLSNINGHDRVWVVYSHSHDDNDLINIKLSEIYPKRECTEFYYIDTCLFEN